MAFLNETGVGDVFTEVKSRLSKKANSADVTTELAKKVDKTSIGAVNGVASLDANGTVPASELPSYVDDVIEGYLKDGKFYSDSDYKNLITGETGKIYIDLGTNDNKTYRFKTDKYVPISDVPEATLKDIEQLQIDVNKLVNITYSELKILRDSNGLMPGRQYRITDYITTTAQDKTKSAGHQFDIIIIADSTNKLNEVARAIRHDNDEELSDATSTTATDGTVTKTAYFANSKLEAWKIWYCLDNDTARFTWADTTNGKGVIYRMIDEFNNDVPYDFKNIMFARYHITGTTLKCTDLVGYYAAYDSAITGFTINANNVRYFYTFNVATDEDIEYDKYGSDDENYEDATLSNKIINNNIDKNNKINAFCLSDSSDCQKLNNIVFINLGNFDEHCGNSFNNNCRDMTFGGWCVFNSFGNECYYNSFGNSCYSNSFGNSCYSNSFGNECDSNSFGNSCNSNSFGNECYSNSFGNECYSNELGNNSTNNTVDAYYVYNKFEDGIKYVVFDGVGTYDAKVQNYHIKQGMTFTKDTKHTITAKTGLNYELTVAKQSDGTVVEYCEADLLKAISTSTITNSAKSNLD